MPITALHSLDTPRLVRQNVEEYELNNGKKILLLAQGVDVNFAAGDGHSIEMMDLIYSLTIKAIVYGLNHKNELSSGVYTLPKNIENEVAQSYL